MTKSAEELEREVEMTRSRVDHTVEALGERMTPGQLVDEVVRGLRGNGASASLGGLGRQIRDRPLPVALVGVGLVWIGAGLVWLALGTRKDRPEPYIEYDEYRGSLNQPGEDRYSAASRPPGDLGGLP